MHEPHTHTAQLNFGRHKGADRWYVVYGDTKAGVGGFLGRGSITRDIPPTQQQVEKAFAKAKAKHDQGTANELEADGLRQLVRQLSGEDTEEAKKAKREAESTTTVTASLVQQLYYRQSDGSFVDRRGYNVFPTTITSGGVAFYEDGTGTYRRMSDNFPVPLLPQ